MEGMLDGIVDADESIKSKCPWEPCEDAGYHILPWAFQNVGEDTTEDIILIYARQYLKWIPNIHIINMVNEGLI